MIDMNDDFAEFDTSAEDILRGIDEGEPATFATQPVLFISYSAIGTVHGWPIANAETNTNPDAKPLLASAG